MMLCHCFLQIEASKLSSHPVAEVTITAPSAPRARGDCIRDDEGHDDRDIRCVVCVMSWKRWERRRSQRRKVDFIKQTALLTVWPFDRLTTSFSKQPPPTGLLGNLCNGPPHVSYEFQAFMISSLLAKAREQHNHGEVNSIVVFPWVHCVVCVFAFHHNKQINICFRQCLQQFHKGEEAREGKWSVTVSSLFPCSCVLVMSFV